MPVSERGATKFAELPSAAVKQPSEFDRLLRKQNDKFGRELSHDPDVQKAVNAERRARAGAFREAAVEARRQNTIKEIANYGRKLDKLMPLPFRASPLGRLKRALDLGLFVYDLSDDLNIWDVPGAPITIPATGGDPSVGFDPTAWGWEYYGGGCGPDFSVQACEGAGATLFQVLQEDGTQGGIWRNHSTPNPFGLAEATWNPADGEVVQVEGLMDTGYYSANTYLAGENATVPQPQPATRTRTTFVPGVVYIGAAKNPNVMRDQLQAPKEEVKPENDPDFDDRPLQAPSKWAVAVTQTQTKRIDIGKRVPDRKGQKTKKVLSKSKALMVATFHALDVMSEMTDFVDVLFDALPASIQKKYKKNNERENKGLSLDNAGQYGWDGADWKARALWENWEAVDFETAVENFIKNTIEDTILGAKEKARPKNSINAFKESDMAFAKKLNELLDEHIRFRQGATHLEAWHGARTPIWET